MRVKFEYSVHNIGLGKDAFTIADGMPAVPRVGDYVDLPQMGGEFKVRKVIWRLEVGNNEWVAHIDLRKPFTSEF
jgi:hypothetical protein